jgi:hypothetical protein
MGLLWRIEHVRSLLTGSEPLVTKETTHSALSSWRYSNAKATKQLGITFRPIAQSVADFVPFYKRNFLG